MSMYVLQVISHNEMYPNQPDITIIGPFVDTITAERFIDEYVCASDEFGTPLALGGGGGYHDVRIIGGGDNHCDYTPEKFAENFEWSRSEQW
jgi:hypothetical protein